MYYVLFIIVLLGAILELNDKKSKNILYYILICIMTLMLCFRYGQGTDYFGYNYLFNIVPKEFNIFIEKQSSIHGEFGWNFIVFICKNFGINFEIFIIIISLIMMFCLNKTIKEYSPLKICSLLLFIPTYYMTYYCSALRQGVVLGLFLTVGLEALINKKIIKYCFWVIIFSLLHSSSIVLIFLPILTSKKIKRNEIYFLIIALAIFAFGYIGGLKYIPLIGRSFKRSISFEGIIIRVIYYFIVRQLHENVKDYNDAIEKKLFDFYFIGFYMSIALSFSSILAQRGTMPIKAIEIILIPLQIYILYKSKAIKRINIIKNKKRKSFIFNAKSVIIIYTCIMLFIPIIEFNKNINAYLKQGKYYKEITTLKYPYITIWNKEDIYNYINSNRFLDLNLLE